MCIQRGAGDGPEWQWGSCHIPRGDLQTTFLFKGFDEVRRLGLNRDTEAEVRAALAANGGDSSALGQPCSLLTASSQLLGSPLVLEHSVGCACRRGHVHLLSMQLS